MRKEPEDHYGVAFANTITAYHFVIDAFIRHLSTRWRLWTCHAYFWVILFAKIFILNFAKAFTNPLSDFSHVVFCFHLHNQFHSVCRILAIVEITNFFAKLVKVSNIVKRFLITKREGFENMVILCTFVHKEHYLTDGVVCRSCSKLRFNGVDLFLNTTLKK